MERNVRYLLVGIIVALLLALFTATVIWQAQRYGRSDGDLFTVAVPGDVGGLKQGSVVRYLGVRAGRVTDIRLSPGDAGRVEVDVRLRPNIPVSRATVARIRPLGITGESFVALETPDPDAGPAPRPEWAAHPVIRAEPSVLAAVLDDLPGLVERVDRVVRRIGRLARPANVDRVDAMLVNAQRLSARLTRLTERADGLLGQGSRTLKRLDRTLADVAAGAETLGPALRSVRGAAERVEAAAADLEQPLTSGADALARLRQRTLPRAEALIEQLRAAARDLETLTGKLARNPSRLVHRPPQGGMELPP